MNMSATIAHHPVWLSDFQINHKGIYLPCSQAYTELSFQPSLSSPHKYLIEVDKSVKELCSQHQYIHLKLRPNIADIRPFLWNDFIAIKRYTYLCDLTALSDDVLNAVPEYRKWAHLQVLERNADSSDLRLHLDFLKAKIPASGFKQITQDLHQHIHQLNSLNVISEKGEVLAQMLYNHQYNRAEQLFYVDDPDFKRNRGGIFAQYAFLKHFRDKGFAEFDFCGANMKSIALYKSRFPVHLASFYELWYHQHSLKKMFRRFMYRQ